MKKQKIVRKGYQVDFSKIEEGYSYSSHITYAESLGKARALLLDKCSYEYMCLKDEEREVTYLNIPVIRYPEMDTFMFGDKEMTQQAYEEHQAKNERSAGLQAILDNNIIKFCYIRKGSYYGPDSNGYTDFRHKAGIYTKEEAVSHAKYCDEIWLEVIDVTEHNKMIQDEIKDLQTRILK